MGIKKTQNEVEAFFKSKGYILLEKYARNNVKMLCEKSGYYYKISYNDLWCGKSPTLWGFSNIDNIEHNVCEYLKKNNSETQLLSYESVIKGKKKSILLHLLCSCGNKFTKTLEGLVYKKHPVCYKCSLIKRGRNKRQTRKNIQILNNAGYTILQNRTEILSNEYVEVTDSLDYLGFVKPNKIMCRNDKMARFDVRINKKHYIENVNNWIKSNGLSAQCIGFSDKEYSRQGILCKCECGNLFETSISSFQNGKIRCEKCAKSISKYEYVFKKYLDKNSIKYIYQYSLNQCRDILPLPFDFYLVDYNTLVEIDGEGHYMPCNFNHTPYDKAEIAYKMTKKHDEIKTNYCIENKIRLIRLPYFVFKNKTWQEIFQNSLERNEL